MQFLFSIFISIIVFRFSIYNLETGSLKLFLKLDRNGNIIYIGRISWYCSGFPIPHKRTKLQRFRTCGSDGLYWQSRGGLQSIMQTVDLQLPFYTSIIIYLDFLSDHEITTGDVPCRINNILRGPLKLNCMATSSFAKTYYITSIINHHSCSITLGVHTPVGATWHLTD